MHSDSQLRFGIMCSGTSFSDYAAEAIEKLLDMERVSLELLIVDDRHTTDGEKATDNPGAVTNFKSKLLTLRELKERKGVRGMINTVQWHFYTSYRGTAAADVSRDMAAQFEDVDRLYCTPRQDGFSVYFDEGDLEHIREFNLDFIFRRGFGIVRGDIHNVAKYGIWSYHHDDERKYRGSPPCFWEIYNSDPITGAILQRLTDRLDGGIILKRGHFPTISDHLENINQVKYSTADWPAQVANDILNGNGDYVNSEPSSTDAKIYKKPSPPQLLRFLIKTKTPTVGTLFQGHPDWNIGVIKSPIQNVIEKEIENEIEWFPRTDTSSSFIADPFGCEINGEKYIFFEEYMHEKGKGRISFVRYDDGFESSPEVALEEPFHISYPYLFTHEGDVYAVPETNDIREIRLYRVREPSDWVHEATILSDVPASDPTVIKHKDYWWMFYTSHGEGLSHLTDLRIQYSSDLTGEWKAHGQNPVKNDCRSARPGGTPFNCESELYRPAQYCAGEYGEKVVLNRVTELSPGTFSEKRVREIQADSDGPYPVGRHTLSAFDDMTLIDGKRRVYNIETLKKRLSQVYKKLK